MNHANALAHLDDYFDGTLSPDLHREIEAHLAGCTRCRDELSSLGALFDTVAEMRGKQVAPSRDLWPEIVTQIVYGRRSDAQQNGGSAGSGDRGFAAGGWNPSRGAIGERRVPWPRLVGVAGLAAAALLLVVVFGGKDGRHWLTVGAGRAGGTGGEPGAPVSSATSAAEGPDGIMTRELAMLRSQVESSRQSVRPVSGTGGADTEVDTAPDAMPGAMPGAMPDTTPGAVPDTAADTAADNTLGTMTDTTAGTPSWRLFDQGLAVLDRAIKDSRAALERDPNNSLLQKSLLAAYQKQLELIRWANRVVRQS